MSSSNDIQMNSPTTQTNKYNTRSSSTGEQNKKRKVEALSPTMPIKKSQKKYKRTHHGGDDAEEDIEGNDDDDYEDIESDEEDESDDDSDYIVSDDDADSEFAVEEYQKFLSELFPSEYMSERATATAEKTKFVINKFHHRTRVLVHLLLKKIHAVKSILTRQNLVRNIVKMMTMMTMILKPLPEKAIIVLNPIQQNSIFHLLLMTKVVKNIQTTLCQKQKLYMMKHGVMKVILLIPIAIVKVM